MKKYVIGMDFGTLSARALAVRLSDGEELGDAVFSYPHGVMEDSLPSGKRLPALYALQHPEDYLDALRTAIPELLAKTGILPQEVAALGIDFTACSFFPVDETFTPLCRKPAFADEPHAYCKIWKHHGDQAQAERMTALAKEMGENWLDLYGGKVSPEWLFPKLLETAEEAPAVFSAAYRFVEAADWLSYRLTGRETHSAPFAGYKAFWNAERGYLPSEKYLSALSPLFQNLCGTKLSAEIAPLDERAGILNDEGAALTGLLPGTVLALPMIDGHAAMPALGLSGDGDMMIILGTSACHILNSAEEKAVPGICGYVRDGVIPGCVTYEAGQSANGDCVDWFVRENLPEQYTAEARERGISVHKLLREKAERMKPGESGLLALDWLGGNRSILADASLSGLMLGMTLATKPEEQYRAWIEATAFGTKRILDNFEEHGIPVRTVTAAGGIAAKDPMMMQIYADVTGREIAVAGTAQAAARGSAVYAAAACGAYPSVKAAAKALAVPPRAVYRPIPEHEAVYGELYEMYCTLHDLFGVGDDTVMKRLYRLRVKKSL